MVSDRLDVAIEREAERAREDETRRQEDDAAVTHSEAVEMYLDSDTDDSEAEWKHNFADNVMWNCRKFTLSVVLHVPFFVGIELLAGLASILMS